MIFYKGMDVSMVKELEEYGAKYRLHGQEKDLFEILKETGTNLVRLRLWNDPYDKNGEAYGGGTNDLETTIELARRIRENGMEFMLDIHYSDFWADPAKQFKPKEWETVNGPELQSEVYTYTHNVLETLKAENLLPHIVQVGNEITNGFLWPDGRVENLPEMAALLQAGIRGVKKVDSKIKILLHLDFGTDNKMYREWFQNILPYGLDFDMIGMSYYPYWNGELKDLLYNMNDMSRQFGKDIIIVETAIGYTTDALGCNGVIFSKDLEEKTRYPATQEGQETFLHELCECVRSVNDGRGRGIVYWEPAWLPIPECAWARRGGCEYMNDKAELGNSWANQALFDADGNANRALVNLREL